MVAYQNLSLYYKNALKLRLPATFSPELQIVNIYLGKKNYYFLSTLTPFNNVSASQIANNKYYTNQILAEARFPVPKAVPISRERFKRIPLDQLIKELSFPLVAKPQKDGGRGRDVLCHINDRATLFAHLEKSFVKYPFMQVEEFHGNLREYRVLVFHSKILGVVERFSAFVIGDGKHSIESLIALKNQERAKKQQEETLITHNPLVVDEEYKNCLQAQGLSLDTVIPVGQRIKLCYTVNTGRGGDIFSHGKKLNAQNAEILVKAAKLLGLAYVGFDLLCEDINRPFEQTKWLILEANYNPDITLHEVPTDGKTMNVSRRVLKYLIYRHPFSYLYHLVAKEKLLISIKIVLSIGALSILLGILDRFC